MTLTEFVTNKQNNHKALICNANLKRTGYTLNNADAKLEREIKQLTDRSPLTF
jgi:hypothetical protein